MRQITPFIIGIWILSVEAKNDTLVHGWRAEPDARGTWSILWSCLATIFVCTYSVLHLEVPKRHGQWYLLFRKVRYMLVASIAPEFILFDSAASLLCARSVRKSLVQAGVKDWSLTHLQFADAQGFWIHASDGNISPCRLKDLAEFISDRGLVDPPISEEELKSRGKSDWFIKLIAVIQTIWFVVQALVRKIQGCHVAPLEIMTVAFVLCSVVTYGFYIHLPQNIEYPVQIKLPNAENSANKDLPTGEFRHRNTTRIESIESTSFALCLLFACGFGAMHCLAWNATFPTSQERLAWRICAVVTTVTPAASLPWYRSVLFNDDDHWSRRWFALVVVTYTIGRITIIVLAFIGLRTLPADAFRTVDWNQYIPHFSG